MFGRKAKRIAQLEADLRDARENLANITFQFPEPVKVQFKLAAARKGQWYHAECNFRVADDAHDLSDLILTTDSMPPYFDGSTPPTVGPKGTAGDSGASDD